jgi:hypothetical protein
MNRHRNDASDPSDRRVDRLPVDESEWQAQERAWRDERDGVARADDPLQASYRTVVRALCTPPPGRLPSNFAVQVAAHAARLAMHPPLDLRFEQRLMRALVGVFALTAAGAAALYGQQAIAGLAALVPALSAEAGRDWITLVAGCMGLSWSFHLLRRRRQATAH